MKPIEPDFWRGRGRYSKKAIKQSAVDHSPIVDREKVEEVSESRSEASSSATQGGK